MNTTKHISLYTYLDKVDCVLVACKVLRITQRLIIVDDVVSVSFIKLTTNKQQVKQRMTTGAVPT